MFSRDTSTAAQDAQVVAVRRLRADERILIAADMSEATRQMAIDGLVRRRPELTRREALQIVRARSASIDT